MKRFATLLLIAIPTVLGAVGPGARVSDLSLERCEFREVIARMQYESIEKAAAIAEQSLPVLKQLEQINVKAKIPGKPLQDQLDPQDIAKFTELSQRLQTTQIAQLMESRRQRDLMVIEKMVMLADREYRWQDHPSEKDPDYLIYASIQLLRFTVKKDDITVPAAPICSLEFALHSIENEPIGKINASKDQLDSATISLKSILAKYRMDKLDRSRLSKADLEKVNELQNKVFKPLERQSTFIKDLEHIKLMARASEIMYEANKQDIAFGGGDVNAIGKTLQRRSKNNEFDEDTQIAIGLWTKINEKIPSEVVQEWSEASKQLEKIDARKKGEKTKN